MKTYALLSPCGFVLIRFIHVLTPFSLFHSVCTNADVISKKTFFMLNLGKLLSFLSEKRKVFSLYFALSKQTLNSFPAFDSLLLGNHVARYIVQISFEILPWVVRYDISKMSRIPFMGHKDVIFIFNVVFLNRFISFWQPK